MEPAVEVLVVGRDAVRRLLPMERCIELVAGALANLAGGAGVNPLRSILALPRFNAALAVMPGALDEPAVIGLKAITVFPGNRGTGFESHQGFVTLFETEHGSPIALVDAAEVTAIRTAAASGVATRLLSRQDAAELAIIGSGTQARTHLEAMLAVRPDIRTVRAWSPNRERLEAFAAEMTELHRRAVTAVEGPRQAIEDASIVCTVSAAREPVVEGAWLAPGCHINAVGSSQPTARELDAEAVRRARLIVDNRESALHEGGDFLAAREAGLVGDEHIAGELGQVVIGEIPGRSGPDEITLFKSHGIAVEDLAAAHEVWRLAKAEGIGTVIQLT
jgi:ornithine cyclodeaminase/alanine dehydrogenase-like protein (mu-crystallin family)